MIAELLLFWQYKKYNLVGGSGRVGSWKLASAVGRVGSMLQWVGSGRVMKLWPTDNSVCVLSAHNFQSIVEIQNVSGVNSAVVRTDSRWREQFALFAPVWISLPPTSWLAHRYSKVHRCAELHWFPSNPNSSGELSTISHHRWVPV